jgi:hypothetical protein
LEELPEAKTTDIDVRVLDAYKLQCIAEAQEGMMEQDKPLIFTRAIKVNIVHEFSGKCAHLSTTEIFYLFIFSDRCASSGIET